MNSIQLLFAFALTVIPGTLSVPTSGFGGVDPIVSIFGVCDTEADDKVSMKEIQGNTDCWNMLENAGMQNTSITDEFSMIDKDQDGYVSMAEAYDAAKTLDRKGGKTAAPPEQKQCHANFAGSGTYTAEN